MSDIVKQNRQGSAKKSALALVLVLAFAAVGGGLLLHSYAAVPPPQQGGYYQLTPPGSAFRSDADCAAEVKARNNPWEPRPENSDVSQNKGANQGANQTVPPTTYHVGPDTDDWNQAWNDSYRTRITGNFTGTTDQIFQWAACKWGWSDEMLRAEAVDESEWFQAGTGDNESRSAGHCPYDITSDPCPTSYGILQTKWYYHPPSSDSRSTLSSYPYIRTSTAFEVDFFASMMRGCYDGMSTYLGGSSGGSRGDAWGCVGSWYSGGWHDADGNAYISRVQGFLNQKPWLSWPDKSGATGTGGADTQAPTVTILKPVANGTVSGVTTVSATATDNVGVTRAEFYVGGQLKQKLDVQSGTAYNFTWNTLDGNTKNGTYNIAVKAYDAAGNSKGVDEAVIVQNADTQNPTVPTNVTAIVNPPNPASPLNVQVNWGLSTDDVAVASYTILRSSTGTNADIIATVLAANAANGFNDRTVSAGKTYTYYVQAVDTSGHTSALSAGANATTPAATDTVLPVAKITAPADGATITGITEISATATDNVGISKIEFYVDGILIYKSLVAPAGTGYSTKWDTSLINNTSHIIRVVAYDTSGNAGETKIAVTTNNKGPSLTAPSSVNAVATAYNSVYVSWNRSTVEGTGYYVQRATPGSVYTTLNSVAAGVTSYVDNSVQASTLYYYRIVAFDAANNTSAPSANAAQVTTPPSPAPATVRINVGGGEYSNPGNLLVQKWSADQYFTGGQTNNQAAGHAIAGTDDDPLYQDERYGAMSYNIPVPNGKYTVRLHFAEIFSGCQYVGCRIFNVGVNGTPFLSNFDIYGKVGGYTALVMQTSTAVTNQMLNINFTAVKENPQVTGIEIIPGDTEPPRTPQNLSAFAVSPTQINLSWTPTSDNVGVTAYRVYRNGSAEFRTVNVQSSTSNNVITWADTQLSPATTYSYTVRAVDAAGNLSEPSNMATAVTPKAPTVTPGALGGTVVLANPTNPYSCAGDPQLVPVRTAPAAGSTMYLCTQKMQWGLNLVNNAGLTVNGWYNFGTCAAVNNFKTRVGLTPDCIFGTGAWRYLETYMAKTAPARDVLITITGAGGSRYYAQTDSTGTYSVPNLAPGNYLVSFARPGYVTQILPANVASNQTALLNVTLKRQ